VNRSAEARVQCERGDDEDCGGDAGVKIVVIILYDRNIRFSRRKEFNISNGESNSFTRTKE
jgi:hypothetical protein